MRRVLPVLLCLALLSPVCAQRVAKQVLEVLPPDENPQYFPIGLFSENSELSEWTARRYAKDLRGLGEPSLWKTIMKPDWAVYRFTLIPSRAPGFVLRLMVDPNGDGTLLVKRWTQGEGAESSRLRQESVPVGRDQVKEFVQLLADANFWVLSTGKLAGGVDGQEWLLEGRRSSEYHVVDRWDGAIEDGYRNACEYLQVKSVSSEIMAGWPNGRSGCKERAPAGRPLSPSATLQLPRLRCYWLSSLS